MSENRRPPRSNNPSCKLTIVLAGALLTSACGGETNNTAGEANRTPPANDHMEEIAQIAAHPQVENAFRYIEDVQDRTLGDHIMLTEIPAPPFMEGQRALKYAELLAEAGADSVYIDDEGNAIGVRKGRSGSRVVGIGGHLDTVFPEDTDVTVTQRGDTLFAPGIGDNTRGLVVLLTVLRAMQAAGLETEADLLFIGTVGEEGLGDLRGMKHLFGGDGPQIDAFIAVDGGGDERITNGALGSRRYRVTFRGPGGHSWGAFGLPNPAHTLARAVQRFDEEMAEYVAEGARTSYNVGRIGGGTSVNAIPFEAWLEVDMRSVDADRLIGADSIFQASVIQALTEHNAASSDGDSVTVELELVGDRPSGMIDPAVPIIARAMAATRYLGREPRLRTASTDSNIPISLGVPAVTIGRGSVGGGTHSLDEWWLNRDGHISIQRALLVVLAEAGLVVEMEPEARGR